MSIKHNKTIERDILILSDTFFKEIENDKKVYICDEIKDHKLFNDKKLRENMTEYHIKENMKTHEGKQAKNEVTMSCLMTICHSLKQLVNDTKRKEIIKALSKKYKTNYKEDQLEAFLLQFDSENSEN